MSSRLDQDLGRDDVVLVIMGSTGTGKSSFIKLLTNNGGVKIGNNLDSLTSDVQVFRFLDRTSGRRIAIVDTPGFDDSRSDFTDTAILKKIAEFLLDKYDKKQKVSGLVYLHRMSDPRFGGQATRNLKMFQNLCGTNAYRNIVVLTTFWDRVSMLEGAKREGQLQSMYFSDIVVGGALFMRHDRTARSAAEVLAHILTLRPTNLQIQEEIRVGGKALEDTAAGSVHREEIERIMAKYREEVSNLSKEISAMKQDNNVLMRELEEEKSEVQQHLKRWESEKAQLKRGLDNSVKFRERLETQYRSSHRARSVTLEVLLVRLKEEKKANIVATRMSKETTVTRVVQNREDDPFQFEYSKRYPPFMKIIPIDERKNVLRIFDFTSLAETTVLLFVQPDVLWSKLRNLAPDQTMVDNSMQAIEVHNYRLHTEARQRAQSDPGARDMYFSRNIGLRGDWYTDAAFGQQQFTGTNPTTITLAPRRWIDEFLSVSHAQGRADVTKLLTERAEDLFVQDYSGFRSDIGLTPAETIVFEGRYGCSSVALFHLEPEGKLHPLAIVPDYRGGIQGSVTIFNRRIASNVDGDEYEDWPWRYAKMCVQVSDWLRHEIAIHLVNTHFVEEVIIVAAYRCFGPNHIIFRLLEPHWSTTLSLNKAARETLVPKIIIPMIGLSATQTYDFLKAAYKRFDWTGLYIPNDLRGRGFPIESLDEPKYHNYTYARDISQMWNIIRKFVGTVLAKEYVGGDREVLSDGSIADFCDEVRAHDGGQLTSFPEIKTLDELIDFVTMCIHIAAPQHTAVNCLQQYYQTFVPNKPSALHSPLPESLLDLRSFTEDDVLAALPLKQPRDWLLMAQVPYLLSFEVPEDSTILHYAETASNSKSTPDIIRTAARALKADLETFIHTVEQNSRELDDQQTPYLVLDPSQTAISILI
ncbi:lipoxygenase [Lentinula aciculospora]|uniref:Manganese lipoxygenase n=1 Tax=Lentinula aciculospora TaxID=153920 RepID=A0A9W9ADK9_9AGAR|nr:lipoxygenase [Lentinula aciculospora]